MENIIGVVGPMATCVEDMRLFCRVVSASQQWLQEPSLVALPWKPAERIQTPLKIGVIWNDGIVQAHPSITRCLQETVISLKAAGHSIVTWDTKLHRDLVKCINIFYFLDAGDEFHGMAARGEPASSLVKWLLDKTPEKSYSVSETWKVSIFKPS
jgi:amidase